MYGQNFGPNRAVFIVNFIKLLEKQKKILITVSTLFPLYIFQTQTVYCYKTFTVLDENIFKSLKILMQQGYAKLSGLLGN